MSDVSGLVGPLLRHSRGAGEFLWLLLVFPATHHDLWLCHPLPSPRARTLRGGSKGGRHRVAHITLALGGLAYINLDDSSAKGDLGVTVAGAVHVPLFTPWFLIYLAPLGEFQSHVSLCGHNFCETSPRKCCWLNIYLLLFNLLDRHAFANDVRIISSHKTLPRLRQRTAVEGVITLSVIMSCGLLAYGFILCSFSRSLSAFSRSLRRGNCFPCSRNDRLGEHPPSKYSDRSGNRASGSSWSVQAI